MDDYKVKQIWPAHADHISNYKEKYLNQMFLEENVVAQRKYDGERMLIHFNGNETYCTSRRISKKTNHYMENQDKLKNLPTLENLGLDYTVIDCECYSTDWSAIVGILHSLPERAYQLQETVPVKFAVFDCLWYDGIDISDRPYEERLQFVHDILDILYEVYADYRFHFVEQFRVNNLVEAYSLAKSFWAAGYEGIVVKSLDRKYYDKGAMLKIKRFETVDLVVYDYQQGTGKYSDVVGALLIGYYDKEKDAIIHCSKVNCGTDEDRIFWKNYFDNEPVYRDTDNPHGIIPIQKMKVLEVKCQEITDKSLRHPVYIRIRDDKSPYMCTKETIFKEDKAENF